MPAVGSKESTIGIRQTHAALFFSGGALPSVACGRHFMALHRGATAAAHRFAAASIPAAVAALRACPGRGTPCTVPFYEPQSPARAALKEVLATLHDVAHGFPADRPPSRGSGVCVVGNKGTGTSTVLATAAAAVRELLPQYGRVVHFAATKQEPRLGPLLDDRVYGNLHGPTAVFVDDAHHLCADDWNCLRHMLRASGQRAFADGAFAHDPRICVVTAGNDSTMADLREHECGDAHEYFARVAVQPLRTVAAYRALHRHVRAGGQEVNCVPWPAQRQALLPPCTDVRIEAAVRSWHLHTGGNFALLHGALSTGDLAEARELVLGAADLRLAKSTDGDETLQAACLEFLRRRLFQCQRGPDFCAFEAAETTATGDELLQAAACQWRRRRCRRRGRGTTPTPSAPDLQELCDRGFLRVVSHTGSAQGLAPCTEYGFGKPFLAMTSLERRAHARRLAHVYQPRDARECKPVAGGTQAPCGSSRTAAGGPHMRWSWRKWVWTCSVSRARHLIPCVDSRRQKKSTGCVGQLR